jgi:sugar transferase EpsL
MPILPRDIPVSKRILDLGLTIPGLIVISPLLTVITMMVASAHGWPVIFSQMRAGYRGKPFSVFKFRSMTDTKDQEGELLPDDERLTRFGRFLRSTSLDELPELFNVILGDMSLVGPRPLLVQYLERYSTEQARRHNVLPGITGWAQINGRNALTWEEKFSLDVWYVDHRSFWLDVKILLITLWKVIIREGISQPGQATAEEFMGTQGDTPKWQTPAR